MPGNFGNAVRNALRTTRSRTQSERLVLVALACHVDSSGVAFPNQETIAELVGLTVRNVRNALRGLEACGDIDLLKAGRGRGRSARYRVNVALMETRSPATAFENGNPVGARKKTGRSASETRSPTTSEDIEDIKKRRAGAREVGFSSFFEEGLANLELRRPGIAASWGPKVQSAEKDGSTLRIGCASDFAASHLATHHQRDFIEAFAPDAARVVFQAGGPFDAN